MNCFRARATSLAAIESHHILSKADIMTPSLRVTRRTGALASAACGLLLLFGASGVAAAPGGAPKWETFPVTCNGETFTITASLGQWSVGHIVGENGIHVVPYGFSIIVTDLDTGETLFSASYTKPGNRGGEPTLCSNYDEILDPETGHLIAIDFTSLVHIRGN